MDIILTGEEQIHLSWREGNGIYFDEIALKDINEQILEDILLYKNIALDSDEIEFSGEFHKNPVMWIGDPDDYFFFEHPNLLTLIKMGCTADILFKQGKSDWEVFKHLNGLMRHKKHEGLIYTNWCTSAYKDDAADEIVAKLKARKSDYLNAFHEQGFVWVAPVDQAKMRQRCSL